MKTIILGGGLGGLSAAFYALKAFPKEPLTIIEASNRIGGWIRSFQQENGIVFEQGPRTVRTAGAAGVNTLKLIEEIGLQNQIMPITRSHPAARTRLIYVDGKLHTLPSGLLDLFLTMSPFSKPLVVQLLKDVFTPKKAVAEKDESLYDFTNRRFGNEVADYLISPLVCGVCAGDAKEISVNFLMKSLFEMEQNHGSISMGLIHDLFKKSNKNEEENSSLVERCRNEQWSIFSFPKGLETLPQTLSCFATDKGADIKRHSPCVELKTDGDRALLKMANGQEIPARKIISSIPAQSLSALVKKQHPHLSELLNEIQTTTVAVVNLCFDKKHIEKDAFGFLVAPKEDLPILGVIYDTCCFPKDEKTVLTVMMGGFRYEKYFGANATEDFLYKTALSNAKQILAINEEPSIYKVQVLKNCIPQYTVGHNKRINDIEEYIGKHKLPIYLCGSSYYGVGINDVILSARHAVERLEEDITQEDAAAAAAKNYTVTLRRKNY